MKKKILIAVIVVIAAIRAVLPQFILSNLNDFLGSFSKVYTAHLEDFDLSIIRGAYRLEGLTVKLKKDETQFVAADAIDISLSWRELFRGKVLTDIVVERAQVVLVPELFEKTKENSAEAKADAQEVKGKIFPFQVSRVDLRQSSLQLTEAFSVPAELRFQVRDIEGRLSNIASSEENPIAFATLRGRLLDEGTLKAVAQFNMKADPVPWNVALELRQFEMPKANPWLKKLVPITFESGRLDMYSEMSSENSRLQGYVKPFVKKMKVIGDRGDFKGIKHFGVEIAAAFANFIFSEDKTETVATKVLFTYEAGKFEWNQNEALKKAIDHAYNEKIEPGLENLYNLQKPVTKGTVQ